MALCSLSLHLARSCIGVSHASKIAQSDEGNGMRITCIDEDLPVTAYYDFLAVSGGSLLHDFAYLAETRFYAVFLKYEGALDAKNVSNVRTPQGAFF